MPHPALLVVTTMWASDAQSFLAFRYKRYYSCYKTVKQVNASYTVRAVRRAVASLLLFFAASHSQGRPTHCQELDS